ncbi:High-affinity nitrate transporter-activating protein 2.1 [Rhynchospora pubera]|uniref:High-affinity nitrate transporter n=1 Tax=Rhynchospora pubera TaxID=906938 RepID=A0AAV8D6F0_9POAL|nr:High-affinity nitrate transporter-activating protein 2.1 [Rhynchospora pubera]
MAGLRLSKITIALHLLLIVCHVGPSMAVLFNQLPKTLIVTATTKSGDVLHAGEDKFTVTWALNTSLPSGADANYKTVKVLLCYAPISQHDRKWRKSNNDLKKDKTCQFTVVKQDYSATGKHEYTVARDIPTASYFVRAYALDSSDTKVAFGQTTDANKTVNIFEVAGITGRTTGIFVSAIVFSAFSGVALAFFYVVENKKKK